MSNKRSANGSGTIRKRKNGTWEARFTVGKDMYGRQIQRSVYGSTQEEVRQKLAKAVVSIDENTYVEPCKLTLEQWISEWLDAYVKDSVKPYTFDQYVSICNVHIIPALGHLKIADISPVQVQHFYNRLFRGKALSAKTIKNVHGVLHRSLNQAVKIGYLQKNPTEVCELPKCEKTKITPLESDDIKKFLTAISGHQFELVYYVTLFSGMRLGEVLGLTWDCVNFQENTILVNKQLQKTSKVKGTFHLVSTKSSNERAIVLAPTVMAKLSEMKARQEEWAEVAGPAWNNELNLVFTNELGEHLYHETVYRNYKRVVRSIGLDDKRFHDLRHSFAVMSLESGDDIKTVQENLGHSTASFTLDKYGHTTRNMKQRSAQNIEKYIHKVS